MSFLSMHFDRPGPGIPEGLPPKKGAALFFDVFGREFSNLVKLNLMFILFCLPVVTIPAACTAMSRIIIYMIRDKSRFLWLDFVETFKKEFWPSLLCGAVLFVPMALGTVSVLYYLGFLQNGTASVFPVIVSGLVLFALWTAESYVYPMLAFVDLKPGAVLKNAAAMIFIRLPYNLLSFVIAAALAALSAAFFPYTLPVIVFMLFSLTRLVTCMFAWAGLTKYVVREEKSGEARET